MYLSGGIKEFPKTIFTALFGNILLNFIRKNQNDTFVYFIDNKIASYVTYYVDFTNYSTFKRP